MLPVAIARQIAPHCCGSCAQLAVVIGLARVSAALNISVRAQWTEMEDGVLWVGNGGDVAASVVAPDSPASRAGIKPGDLLLAIDTKLVASAGRRGRRAARVDARVASLDLRRAAVQGAADC